MPIEETATDISQWSSTAANNYPTGDGKRGNADDEHRYTKKLIKDKFGAFTGSVNVTATEAELNYTDVTPGTATASKAVVLDASKDVSGINDLGVSGTLTAATCVLTNVTINGSSLTSTGTELNQLAGLTPGTVTLSKAVVVDANKDIGSFRNITATGALTAASGVYSGTMTIGGITTITDTVITADSNFQVNKNASGDRFAYIDLFGDDTNTDYAARWLRNNTGVNADTQFRHSGTGALKFICDDAGTMEWNISGTSALALSSARVLTFNQIPVGPASDPTTDNQLARKAYADSVGVSAAETAEFALPSTVNTSVASGLTALPYIWKAYARCTAVGGDAGYSQGDEVDLADIVDSGNDRIYVVQYDLSAEQFVCIKDSGSSGITIVSPATRAPVTLTASNWRVFVRTISAV